MHATCEAGDPSTGHSNNSEPSLALGFFVSAPPQRMPAAPRAFYSAVPKAGEAAGLSET